MTPLTDDDPRHGSHAGYVAHMKHGPEMCEACRIAGRRYHKASEIRLARGVRSRVPLGKDAHRVLTAHSVIEVAAVTGLNRNLLYKTRAKGPKGTVLAVTRDRILRFRSWTPVGIQRRVRALAAIGWSCSALGERSGMSVSSLQSVRARDLQLVKTGFALDVIDLYDELEHSPRDPTHDRAIARTINNARAARWAPPAGWDNIDHDVRPAPMHNGARLGLDESAVVRAFSGDTNVALHPDDRVELVRRWSAAGRPLDQIEDLFGFQPRAVLKRAS